jgi:phenylacetate-CoA ligase
VVVTSLLAEAMPLIRYKLGDLAVKLPREKYPANRALNLPLLEKVIGRETDLVHTPSGKKMIVHSFTGIFEYYPQIRQFCVIQRSLDGIIIQFIRGDNYYPGVLIEIEARIRSLLNEPFSIVMEEVVEILPTRSGKPQIIMSELNFSGIKRTDSHFTNSQSLN